MKKISLDQISKELNMVESSTDVIKKSMVVVRYR